MTRWMVVATFLLVSSAGRCEGVSVGDLTLGRSVHAEPLAARIAEQECQQHGARTLDVCVPFLGSPVVAHVFVNSEERIQSIEIRLPLARLGEVRRQLIQQFGLPKSDSTSPSVSGLASWERRDKETAVGLFSEPEHDSTLLVVFIWIAPEAEVLTNGCVQSTKILPAIFQEIVDRKAPSKFTNAQPGPSVSGVFCSGVA